jgi:nifR3 family TIM-barrel protein
MIKKNHKIQVRDLKIFPPVVLAPMVGLSHCAFRVLLREQGGFGLFFTEMLAAKRLPHENENVSPLLIRDKSEKTLIYQIVVFSDDQVGPAVEKLHLLGADGIDINLGCPAPRVKKQGGGISLSEDTKLVKKILQAVRSRTDLPVSAKIRLGVQYNEERLYSFCKNLEDQGLDYLTIHARLNGEKFCRKPHWKIIGDIKQRLSIPVLANGGIFSKEDAVRCLDESEADGLMLGRGAAVRPWLAAEISREIYNCPSVSNSMTKPEIFFRFASLLEEKFPLERRLGRLKQFTHYFASTYTFGHYLATEVQNSDTFEKAIEKAEDFFSHSDTI